MGCKTATRPLAKGSLPIGMADGQRLKKPPRTRCNQSLKRGEACRQRIFSVNRQTNIVHKRCREQFLIKASLSLNPFKCLQRLLKHIPFKTICFMQSHI
jgi:hypothetical protein